RGVTGRRPCSLPRHQEMFRDKGRNICERWSPADDPAASPKGTGGGAAGLEPSRVYHLTCHTNSLPLLPHNPPPSPLPISTRPTSSRWVPPYVPWFCLRFLPD